MFKLLLTSVLILVTGSLILAQETIRLKSPDGHLGFNLFSDVKNGELFYSINYKSENVLYNSHLGLIIEQQPNWDENIQILDSQKTSIDSTWKPLYGEQEYIPDKYNQIVVVLGLIDDKNRRLHLIVRAYNEGIAFRYHFPEHGQTQILHINEELTEFVFPKKTMAWYASRPQGKYKQVSIKNWEEPGEMPMTIKLNSGLYVSILEAEMVNYSVSHLTTIPKTPNSLMCKMSDNIIETSPFSTPWRVVMVAEQPGKLLENNFIVLNLNEPSKIQHPWWIQPGKVIREVTLSTEGAKACVDFAVEHNLQYVHFDAGWYGRENHIASDATTITVDPKRNPRGDLNLHEAIRYAKKNNVKVFVYVNHRALERQLDEILPLYKSWGIDGIKFGFVHTGSHRWTVWLHEAIEKAAGHQLMVNVHDTYRPTGFSRTYPNLMTMEGIRGNEEMPDATHNTILPFTRFVAGRGDYTICYYFRKEFGKEKKHLKTTPAHQLALAVVYYSPLQWLFWYDRPSDYQGEPEIEFFEECPTIWDESKFIDGEIGEFAVIARKSNYDWFLGAITNNDERKLEVSFDFLEKGKKYLASIYTDGGDAIKTRTHVRIDRFIVDNMNKYTFELNPSGGGAIHFKEANELELNDYKILR